MAAGDTPNGNGREPLDPRDVGRTIATARDAMGLTQVELAHKLGASPSSVQRWEAGKLPPVRKLLRVARALEIEASELVEPAESQRVVATLAELASGQAELLAIVRDIQMRVARLEQR